MNRILDEGKPEVEMITKENQGQVSAYLQDWYHDFANGDITVRLEALAAERVLPHLETIGGLGILVKIEGKPVGMSVAPPVNQGCWLLVWKKLIKQKKVCTSL